MAIKLNHLPGLPMTQEEMERQCALVAEIAEATEFLTELDEREYQVLVRVPPVKGEKNVKVVQRASGEEVAACLHDDDELFDLLENGYAGEETEA